MMRRRTGENHKFQFTAICLHVVRHQSGFTNDGRQPLREFIDQRMVQRAIIDRNDCLLIIEETDLRVLECSGHCELRSNATAGDFPRRFKWQDPRIGKQLSQDILLVSQRGVVCVVQQAARAAAVRFKVFAVH